MLTIDSNHRSQSLHIEQALSIQSPNHEIRRNFIAALLNRLHTLPNLCFTEIDQAFLVWGVITLIIFTLGQFSALNWIHQAIFDAALTGTGIALTSGLTWTIASHAKLRWVVLLWAGLMSAGTVITVYGIFCGIASVLVNLCLLWLAICALGYGAMAIGMGSRCFTAACLIHLAAIASLDYLSSWQFLSSGLVIASTLLFFSIVPWDINER